MLASVAGAWLLDDERGDRGREFWRAETVAAAEHATMGADLVSNLEFVLDAATRFADDPRALNLIELKPGSSVGHGGTARTDWPAAVRVRCECGVRAAALEAAGRLFAAVCSVPI